MSATCETSTDLEEAKEKDKVVRSVRRADSLVRIQPQREIPMSRAGTVKEFNTGVNSRRISSVRKVRKLPLDGLIKKEIYMYIYRMAEKDGY